MTQRTLALYGRLNLIHCTDGLSVFSNCGGRLFETTHSLQCPEPLPFKDPICHLRLHIHHPRLWLQRGRGPQVKYLSMNIGNSNVKKMTLKYQIQKWPLPAARRSSSESLQCKRFMENRPLCAPLHYLQPHPLQ